MAELSPEQLDEFFRLVKQDGVSKENAFLMVQSFTPEQIAERQVRLPEGGLSPVVPQEPSYGESFVGGVGSGLTLGTRDEAAGYMAANPVRDRLDRFKPGATPPRLSEEEKELAYLTARDADRSQQEFEARNYKTTLAGKVTGGAITGAALGGPVAGPLEATVLGGELGFLQGLGESEGTTTSEQMSEAVGGGIFGAGTSLVADPLVRGGTKLVKGAKKRIFKSAEERAAEKVSSQIKPKELSEIGRHQTVEDFTGSSEALEGRVEAKTGQKLQLRPTQRTGDPAAAQYEDMAGKYPAIRREAQNLEAKNRDVTADYLDKLADDIAADPSKLGRADVQESVTKGIDDHLQSLVRERSTWGKTAYAAPDELLKHDVIDSSIPVGTVREEIARLPPQATEAANRLQKTIYALTKDQQMQTSYKDLRSQQVYWGNLATQRGTIIEGLDDASARRIAHEVSDAITLALDAHAEREGKEGVEALRAANAGWRERTEHIKTVGNKYINGLLKTESADTFTNKILRGADDDIRGVMGILNKNAPETAQQLRAQMFEESNIAGGKPIRETGGMADVPRKQGSNNLDPDRLYRHYEKNASRFEAAYEGDPKAQLAFNEALELMRRLRYRPIPLAEPQGVLSDIANKTVQYAGWGVAGAKGNIAVRSGQRVMSWMRNEKALAKITSTPQGLEIFNRISKVALGDDKQLSIQALDQLIMSLERTAFGEVEEPEVKGIFKGSN